jgi:hypothetical protein
MSKEKITDLKELLAQAALKSNATAYEGFITTDKNLVDHQLLVESPQVFYSFHKEDIVQTVDLGGGNVRILVRNGAKSYRSTLFNVGGAVPLVSFLVGMESMVPPVPLFDPQAPMPATMEDTHRLRSTAHLLPSLATVASNYTGSCDGGDSFDNNCAHFLSNAFIKAGFSELYNNNPNINARCTPARRPIRARDMWSWFQTKAVTTSTSLQKDTGWWAVFQLNESEYWGGHVALFDSHEWKYYGTGWYPQWNQYLYKW